MLQKALANIGLAIAKDKQDRTAEWISSLPDMTGNKLKKIIYNSQ